VNLRLKSQGVLRRLRWELRLAGVAAWRGIVKLVNGNDVTHAASISYYALLSFFPFLLLVFSMLGSISDNDTDRFAVLQFVFRYFPTRLDFVNAQLLAFRETRLQLGVGGSLALIWASLGVFGAITSGVNEAWGVERQRSFWTHRLVSFLMLVAAGGVMIVALLLVGAIEVAQASTVGVVFTRFEWLGELRTLTFDYLATLLLIVAVGLVYYFIPNAKTRFRDVWVGAVLTGVLWRLAFDGFAWYIASNNSMTMIHGSIAAVVVFLFWVYVSSIILMYGVEFTAAYARLRRRRPDDLPAAPSPRV